MPPAHQSFGASEDAGQPASHPPSAGRIANLVGAALFAFATIAVAQSAGDAARSEPASPRSMRTFATTHAADVNDRTKSTAEVLQSHSIPGTAFQPADSSIGYVSQSACIYQSGAGLKGFRAPVYLPSGSRVVSVAIYYYDASVGDMTLNLNQHPLSGAMSLVLAQALSEGTAGYGTRASADINALVDNINYSYSLLWLPSLAIDAQQICGARILYYPPAATAALCSLDVDGNAAIDALTDGLLILRAMFGLTGTSVTNNAIGSGNPSRTTWPQLRSFFNGSCGASFRQ